MRILLCFLLGSLAPLCAQESRASIVGRVSDPSGAVIPGVTVKAVNQATNVGVSAQSNQEGNYQVLFLNPGVYKVTASLQGFKSFERDGVELRINDRLGLDIVLEVGDVREKVVVSAEVPLLETTTANVGQIMDSRRIAELPIPHGSVRSLFYLLGGVTLAGGGYAIAPKFQDPSRPGSSSWLTFNGAPVGSTEFTLDGVPNTQTANSDFGSSISNQPPVDAIQELKLETAYDASVGHTSGSHVNMVIKSGTNSLHGTGYFFYRNPSLNANTFLGNMAGQTRADFDYKRGGFSVNGPVVLPKLYNGRDRTFFSYAYEVMNEKSQGYPFVGTVPALDHRKGDFSGLLKIGPQYQIYDPATIQAAPNGRFSRQPLPGNIIPASRINPIATRIMEYWPSPNVPGLADSTNNYALQNMPSPNVYQDHILRLDHVFSEKHRMYGRFSRYYKTEGKYRDYFLNIAAGKFFQARPYNFVIDDIVTLSPRLIVDFRYGYQRFPSRNWYPSEGFDLTTLGFSKSLVEALSFRHPMAVAFPGIAVSGIQALQPEGTSGKMGDDIHSWFADINRPTGNHALRFGASFRFYRKNNYDFGSGTPRLTFSSTYTNGPLDNSPSSPSGMGQGLAALLLGIPSSGYVDYNDSYAIQSAFHGAYIQDDWRAMSKLTLTLGLRYEYQGPITERFDRSVRGFDPQAQLPIAAQARANYAARPSALLPAADFQVRGGVLFAGQGGQPRGLFPAVARSFMPRIGFSYNPLRDTVVRGGYGIFFLDTGITSRTGPFQLGYSQATNVIPTLDNGVTFRAGLSNLFPDGITTPPGSRDGLMTFVGRSVTFYDTALDAPYLQRWNFNLQQLLPGQVLLETGYAGSRATRLRIGKNYNGLPLRYLSTLPTRDQPVIDRLSAQTPNPFYPMLAGTSLAGVNVSSSQLLTAFPHFTGVSTTTNQGYSWYHGWQTRIERRFANDFTFQLSYTFSKMMEAVSYLNADDPAPYRTVSSNDRTHHIGVTGIYELPFGEKKALFAGAPLPVRKVISGWQIGAVYNQWSGSPLSFGDIIFNGDIKNIPLPKDQRTVERWFNTNAGFERASARQLSYHLYAGPLNYNGIRSDGADTWDLSLLKHTSIGERVKLQIRAEAFNAFNHPNFTPPNTSVTSSAFGVITGEGTFTRQIQFGFKVVY